MKYTVEVSRKIIRIQTFEVEADSKKAARYLVHGQDLEPAGEREKQLDCDTECWES